jgi:sugar lactone lactonase YvrE
MPAVASPILAEPIQTFDRVGPAIFLDHPMGLALDRVGSLIVIADTGNRRIRIVDSNGMPVHDFAHRVDGPHGRMPGEPRAVAVDDDGRLYVIDALAGTIDVMDLLGNTLGTIDPAAIARVPMPDLTPVALTIDASQRLVVAIGAQSSEVWGLDDEHEVSWRLTGVEGDGTAFGAITSIHVDVLGRLLITDATGPSCVRVYGPDRRPLVAFGAHDTGNENFSHPIGIAGTPDGRIWVADATRQSVKAFRASGELEGLLGGRGARKGEFLYPTALATDGQHLFVLERVGARLTTFRLGGPTASGSADVSLLPERSTP